jgi:hypothetical protein
MIFGHRSATFALPAVAAIYTLYGATMILQPAARVRASVFLEAFDFIDRPYWAAAFIIVGLLVLVTFHPIAVGCLVAVVSLWALLLLKAALSDPTISFTGVITHGGLAVILVGTLARRGIRA